MGVRLTIRAGRRAPGQPLTLADYIDAAIDRLEALRRVAAHEQRSHAATEELLDNLFLVGRSISRVGRQ